MMPLRELYIPAAHVMQVQQGIYTSRLSLIEFGIVSDSTMLASVKVSFQLIFAKMKILIEFVGNRR